MIKAEFDGIDQINFEPDIPFGLGLKCIFCKREDKTLKSICDTDAFEVPHSPDIAHYVGKCPSCKQVQRVKILVMFSRYIPASMSGEFCTLDCRGCIPVQAVTDGEGITAHTPDTDEEFSVDFEEGDWMNVTETGESVGIYDFHLDIIESKK